MIEYKVLRIVKHSPLDESLIERLPSASAQDWILRSVTDSGHDSWVLVFSRAEAFDEGQ